jgi:hypothetical protein
LKDAWEQTCFTETFPDKHVTESTDDAWRCFTFLCSCQNDLMKSGCVAKYPANYQLTPKNYFTRLEQDWIMMQSLKK